MNVLSTDLPPVEVVDSVETVRNLDNSQNIPDHLSQDQINGLRASQLEDISAWADTEERWGLVFELYRMGPENRQEFREQVRNDPFEPQVEETAEFDTGDYDRILFDVLPYNLGSTEASDFLGVATLADNLGQSFSSEYRMVSMVDGEDEQEDLETAASNIRELESGYLESDIQAIDERQVKENPPEQGLELAREILEGTGIPLYQGDQLSCRAAEIVRSRGLAEAESSLTSNPDDQEALEQDFDAVITFYPPSYHDSLEGENLYGPGSEWRMNEIEQSLSDRLDTDFYSLAHPWDSDRHSQSSRLWNTAYRILDYEGCLEVSNGQASMNAEALSGQGFDRDPEAPATREDFLNMLNNLVRSAEVSYSE